MSTTFVPPRPDQWQGPAPQAGGFTPPPVSSWQGPSPAASVPGMEKLGGAPPGPAGVPALPGMPGYKYTSDLRKIPVIGSTLGGIDEKLIDPGINKMEAGISQMADPNAQPTRSEQAAGTGPTPGKQILGGASKLFRGAAQSMGPPALIAAGAAAPARTALGLAAGGAAQQGAEKGLESLGVSPDYAEPAGDAMGLVAGGVAAKYGPEAISGAANGIQQTLSPTRDPVDLMTRALKPKSTNVGFRDSLARSMPELKAVEPQLGPIESNEQLLDAIPVAKQHVRAQFNQMLGPQAQRGVDGSPIADAIRETIPDQLILENPAHADAIAAKADVYRQPFTVEQLDDFLKTTNAQLESYYNKYPTSQRKALAGDPEVAALEAKAKATRDVLYGALDDPGQGAAARELNQRYGALLNLEGEANRRLNVALRQAPESLSEQISKWSAAGQAAKGIFRLMRGDLTGAADIGGALTQRQMAKWLKEQNTSDALIKSAFKNYSGTPAPVQMPPPFQPAGLLGKGSIVTPPPADTSGVRSTTGAPLRAPTSRQLPAGPSIRPSSELSGQAGDTIDTVPIKDPITGRVQYAPRPNPTPALSAPGPLGATPAVGTVSERELRQAAIAQGKDENAAIAIARQRGLTIVP